MRVLWTDEAQVDLEAVLEFVGRDDRDAAVRLVLTIIDTVEHLLAANPACGRVGRVPKTRELVIPGTKYIVAYRVEHSTIQALRVIHSARKWPSRF